MNEYYGPYGIKGNELYYDASKMRRKTGNGSLMNVYNALEAWAKNRYPEIAARSLTNTRQNNNIQKWTNAIRRSLKPKTNYKTNYLYRGLAAAPGNIKNVSGFSSWANSLNVARRFAGPRGIVLRLNTKKLSDVPVLWLGGQEREYILPPMKIVMNNVQNNKIVPVTHVIIKK